MTRFLSLNHLPLITVILLSQLLSGCAIFKSKPKNIETNQTITTADELTHWQLKGKLIFKSPEEKFSASLNWTQKDNDSDIRLTTFLGISILKLKQNQQGANLEYDGNNYQAKDAKTLLARHTNLHWPIEQMPLWIKGISGIKGISRIEGVNQINKSTAQTIQYHPTIKNDNGTLTLKSGKISQITLLDNLGNPWQIEYPHYQLVEFHGRRYHLPQQMRLKGQNTSIVIKVNRWTVLE